MRKINKLLIAIVCLFSTSILVYADEIDTLTTTSIPNNQIPESGDTNTIARFNYAFDDNFIFNNNVEGSSAIFGNNLTINSIIEGINLAFGNNLTFNGKSDYMAFFGNVVNINGEILKDGAIFGNNITLSNTTVANRDIVIFGNDVKLSGTFKRDVRIFASSLTIENAKVEGDIVIDSSNITIDKESNIVGFFKYNEDADLKNQNESLILKPIEEKEVKLSTWEIIREKLYTICAGLLILLIIIMTFPKFLIKLENYTKTDNYFKNLGIGLLSLILIPILCLILLISSIGSSLGFVLILIYILLMLLSGIATDYTVGYIIKNTFIKKDISKYLTGIIGIIIMFLLKLIPIIGGIITFISLIYGMGVIIDIILKTRKK